MTTDTSNAIAIAIAVYAATGLRLRSLPLMNRGFAPTAVRESATPA